MAHVEYVVGANFRIDVTHFEIWQGEQKLKLRPTSFRILVCIIEGNGRYCNPRDIGSALGIPVTKGTLRWHVNQIRKCLGDDAKNSKLFRSDGHGGYLFIAPVTKEVASSEIQPHTIPDHSDQIEGKWLPDPAYIPPTITFRQLPEVQLLAVLPRIPDFERTESPAGSGLTLEHIGTAVLRWERKIRAGETEFPAPAYEEMMGVFCGLTSDLRKILYYPIGYAAYLSAQKENLPARTVSGACLVVCPETNQLVIHHRNKKSFTVRDKLHIFSGNALTEKFGGAEDANIKQTAERESFEEAKTPVFIPPDCPLVLIENKWSMQFTFLGGLLRKEQLASLPTRERVRKGEVPEPSEGYVQVLDIDRLIELPPDQWFEGGLLSILVWLELGAWFASRGQETC